MHCLFALNLTKLLRGVVGAVNIALYVNLLTCKQSRDIGGMVFDGGIAEVVELLV